MSSLLVTVAFLAVDSVLVNQARQQADSTRAAISRAFSVVASSTSDRERTLQLSRARSFAAAYATAWKDSFLLSEVTRFERWSRPHQNARVRSDSLKRAGVTALAKEGVPRAMQLWRESLRNAVSINDPSSIAPALLSIGVGHYRDGQLDSADSYARRAQQIALRNRDRLTTANAIGILGSITKDRGDLPRAAELYARASAIRALIGDSRGYAADQNNLGLIAQERGDLRAAAAAFNKALNTNMRDGRRGLAALNLSNLAGLASSNAEYARADSLYRRAVVEFRRSDDRAEAAFTLHDLGRLQIRRGDYAQAAATLSEALRIHLSSGAETEAIEVRNDLAAVRSASGDPEGALQLLRRAETEAVIAKAQPVLRARLAMTRADVSLQFGTFEEATAAYARAESLFGQAGDSLGLTHARHGNALLLHLRGDHARALGMIRRAAAGQEAAGERRAAAITRLLEAEIHVALGHTAAARRILESSRHAFRTIGDPVSEAAALNSLGDLALTTDSLSSAARHFRAGIARLGSRTAPDVAWRLHAGLGESLRRERQLVSAAREFRTAIDFIERSASSVRLEERRSGFLADKWSVYTQLAFVEQARGRIADAFAVSEQLRARQMRDLLVTGRVTNRTASTREEQDLRRRIAELSRDLEVQGPYQSGTREPALALRTAEDIRRELNAAQRAYSALLLRMKETAPEYERLVSGKTVSWQNVAARLSHDEIFLEYLLGSSGSTVFVVTRDTVAAIDLRIERKALVDVVEFSRRTVESDNGRGRSAQWRIPLRRLHQLLIEPVERTGYLRGKNTIVVAPHAQLHFLPFGALITSRVPARFLLEEKQIVYTPSATAWVQLSQRNRKGFGNSVLAYAPNVGRLPASRTEVAAISRIYGKAATVRFGAAASERAFRAEASKAGVVHLATFGVLNKHNPLFSFVELGRSEGDDGRLEVNEVFGLGLSGQLVILSACQTALASGSIADVPPGDDWVGFVEAFLQAGAGSVIASLWPVNDRATAELMQVFHQKLSSGLPPSVAIAEAQRTLMRQSRTSRPYFWAGFVLNGGSQVKPTPASAAFPVVSRAETCSLLPSCSPRSGRPSSRARGPG